MKSNPITDAIDRQAWLDPLANDLQSAVSAAFDSQGEAGERAADFLHGKWMGHPLHPALTDVPIGAWTVAIALDAMEAATGRDDLAPGAEAAIALGLWGAAGSALTGLTDWRKTEGKSKRVGLAHGALNIGATALFFASWLLRKRRAKTAGRAASLCGYALMTAAAHLGGSLVFEERVGVASSSPSKRALRSK